MNNEHKSNEIRDPEKTACFPKYTLDYQHKRLRNTRTVQINLLFAPHYLKDSLFFFFFFPLCDYLFICLLIYFSTPWVQRAEGVWCALMAVFTKGGKGKAAAAFRSKGGEGDMSACLRLHYKSFRLILWGDEEKRIWKKHKKFKNLRWDQGYEHRAHCTNCWCRHVWAVAEWSTSRCAAVKWARRVRAAFQSRS